MDTLRNIYCHVCNQKQLISFSEEDCGADFLADGISCNLPEIICKNCKVHYFACPNCEDLVLMKFLGHDLLCPHEKHYYCAPEWIDDNVFEDCDECISRKQVFINGNDSYTIGASYIDQNIHYVDLKNIINGERNSITGPDGGLYHYWFCENCKSVFQDTDK